MKRILKYIAFTVLSFCFLSGYSQKSKINSVSDDYREFAYVKTSEVLLEVANKGYKSKNLFQKLANSFYFQNKMEEAAKWYGELMNLNEAPDSPEYYFRYALALRGIEKYDESDKWMKKFNEVKPDDLRGQAFMSRVDYVSTINELSNDDIEIINLDTNTEFSDFGTTEYITDDSNRIIFASARGGGRKYRWNEQPYLDLYAADRNEDGTFSNVEELNDIVNTKYHESTVAFTPDQKFMFFTRNNYYNRKYVEDDDGINRLKLYRVSLNEEGEWDDIHSVHFNSDDYSVAHPTINLSGTKLYFASDMEGTFGQSDIFVVDINENGTLGEPENLGPTINTEGQESFPFVNTSGDLYFSSNGYPGLGGFDVFVSRELDMKNIGSSKNFVIENVGKPVNSSADDFGYSENLVTKNAYFSSNRSGGKGSDDIYTFVIPECEQIVEGVVKVKDTNVLAFGSTVILFDENGNEIERTVTGDDAAFSFNLDCEKEYLIRGEKDTFIADEKRFTTPNKKQELKLELFLDKDQQEITTGTDLAEVLDIPIIYFDFDKSNIRYDASVELEKVLAVLNKYPNISLDIRAHTDSRGAADYNEALSDRRAQSTRQYLIDKGVSEDRLTAKGYGESELVNECADGIPCSRDKHQLNRRSEFIITKMK